MARSPRFWSLTKEQRRIHLDRSLNCGETARPSRDPNVWLVHSKTLSEQHGRPVYWRVNVKEATCHCPGYQTLGVCRHTARAIYEAWNATHAPVALPIAA